MGHRLTPAPIIKSVMCLYAAKNRKSMMHSRSILVAVALFPLLTQGTVSAQPTTSDTYACTIKEAKDVSELGLFTTHGFNENSVGEIFFVDRHSGLATGEFRNYVDPSEVTLLSQGSTDQNFVAISFVGPFRYLNYIEIEEWREGLEKPFMAIDHIRGVLAGLCIGR